jgi:hypothetical protein
MFCPKGRSVPVKNGVGKCRRENQGKICTGPLLQVRQRSSQVEARASRRAAEDEEGLEGLGKGGKGREETHTEGFVMGVGRRKLTERDGWVGRVRSLRRGKKKYGDGKKAVEG